jgi:mono/diheme cytochrome c family protein
MSSVVRSLGSSKIVGLTGLMLLFAGCSRSEPAIYVLRPEALALPAKQQAEVSDYLERLYGTYRFPRLRSAQIASAGSGEATDQALPALNLKDQVEPARLEHGREVYTQQCAGCHGTTGAGDGPAAAYLDPPPRDYRKGVFKFISTPRGNKPRREDLVRIIRHGAKGTSMPSFPWMAHDDLEDVIDYVKSLSMRGQLELALIQESEDNLEENDSYDPERVAELTESIGSDWNQAASLAILPQTPMVPYTDEAIELGARAFVQESCYKCHGIDGRGNRQFNVGKDEWGRTAYAANIAAGTLHGGRRPVDIYRRIYSGINGTPMPGFGSALASQNKLDTIWHLTHFVTSIVEGRELPAELLKQLAEETEAAAKRELETQNQPNATEPASETPSPDATTPTETTE